MSFLDKFKKSGSSKRAVAGETKRDSACVVEENRLRDLQVFISCSAKDGGLGRRFKVLLKEKGCRVFFAPDSIQAGAYTSVIADAMAEISQSGCIIVLITHESMKSMWVQKEVAYAFSENGNIIPVLVGNTEMFDVMQYYFSGREIICLPENPTDGEIAQFIDRMLLA